MERTGHEPKSLSTGRYGPPFTTTLDSDRIMVRVSPFALLVFVGAAFAVTEPTTSEQQTPPTESDVVQLEKAAVAGDRTAVRAAFRLRQRSDGAVAEHIDIVLGSTVKGHPRLFLEELKRSDNFARLDSLLGNLGPKYVDRSSAQSRELRARSAALRSVANPELREVRDRCLKELSRMTKERSLSNNTFERTVMHRGPRLSAAQPSWSAAQLGR